MMRISRLVVLATLLFTSVDATAQSQASDLKTLMDSTGLKYSVTKAGNASVTYSFEDGRSQTVYVTGKSSSVGKLQVREVWSNGGYYPEDVDAETLIGLLTAGADQSLGSWNLEADDDGSYLAYFATSIPMTLAGADLAGILEYIAGVADNLEATLSDADDN